VRALPEIRRELPDVRYLLVGAGPDRARIENLAIEIGVRDAVVFTGSVSDAELSDHYNLCDLFAMPSKAEGFGIVYLEALACGKPVIAGNKDGSADALANGDLGLLLDPDDIAAIAREAVRVLRKIHPHPKIFRPEVLRARVTELFGFDTFGLKLRALLKPFLEEDAGEKVGVSVKLESRALDRVSVSRSNYHSPDPQDSAVV
jgi:glycosyltransferase involved in cell wall biosynthesis